jgi:hypothetical protein
VHHLRSAYVAGGKSPGETLALGLSEDPLSLRTASGDRLQFLVAHQFRLIEDKPPGRHAHLPTGRVSVESILRLLLTDLRVPPTHNHESDFTAVLDASERDFIEARSWHG